ncbi:protein of unknown function DUF1844 [Solidesulfovibrio fructosivorans JJ]]|uniref:DUF1844 domain-containing protein n=1 Tax=Solidesulfovibrio fructosivorans JJ] TaxID=596151 RepID=E1JYJ2_SOLFR|nr:DUF1844 domain-containing protein [Solidesulfovibrio fructosivorans]EFL50576.1 protein of unknown function DUF1844 [Solidesulfovibrio fructosivorans JJ]]
MGSDAQKKESPCGCNNAHSDRESCFPPVSFITFVLSLAQSAMVLMGEAPDPDTGEYMQNLPQAKHTIDILAMLACKTRGNLTGEEHKVLDNILCELRMAFVKKQ